MSVGRLVELAEADERLDRIRVNGMRPPTRRARSREASRQRHEGSRCLARLPARARGGRAPRDGGRARSSTPIAREYSMPARQDAARVVDAPEMHRDEAARVPLVLEVAAELPVEVDELGRVRLGLREIPGAHLELRQMEEQPAVERTRSSSIERSSSSSSSGARAGELPGVEQREARAGASGSGTARRRAELVDSSSIPPRRAPRRARLR